MNKDQKSEIEFRVHPVEWTDEKVARFWTFQNQYDPFENIWFTKQVGRGLINFFSGRVPIKGSVLDYGTGKGHLVEHLLNLNQCSVYGFDFSPESIRNVDKKYEGRQNYMGTSLIAEGDKFSGFESEFFDVVFLIEAIEHLTDKYLDSTLTEINRILKPGGKLIITTPNNENLPLQHVCCPDCGGVFHRVQHMRSFTETTLASLMSAHHFRTVSHGTTNFTYFNEKWSIINLLKRMATPLRSGYTLPHLWYIGEK